MIIIYATKWLKKLFGVNSVYKSELEQAAEFKYLVKYEDTSEFNITSVVAGKLANIVCSEASAELAGPGGGMRDFIEAGFRRAFGSLNLIAARAFGIGGIVLKPYVHDGAVYTDIIPQSRFFIIEQRGEIITKAGFIAETVTRQAKDEQVKTRYTRLEYHSLDGRVYTIENRVIAVDIRAGAKSGAGTEANEGREVAIADSPFADIPECASITGVERMLFSFLKCPVDNKRDFSGIYGVPVTYGQEKLMQIITDLLGEIPDEYRNKKAFIGAEDILFDAGGKLPEGGLYKLFRAMGSVDDKPFWEIFSPEIRHGSYFAGLDYLFGLLEKAICVNQGMLTDLNIGNATATAIRRSTLDTFSTVHAMRRNIEGAFGGLVYAFGVIAGALGLEQGGGEYEPCFDWDYRLLEDTCESWKQLLEAYKAGAVELWELRRFIFGESKRAAQAVLGAVHEQAQAGGQRREATDEHSSSLQKVQDGQEREGHVLVYEGGDCAGAIFAPSGIFDDTLNPFRRESWNMGEQARIYRDNPEIAQYLMREAKF